MGSLVRLLFGLPGAAVVTVALFIIMGALISREGDVELTEDRSVSINITRQIEDTEINRQQAEFQRPVLDQPPPPPPAVNDTTFRPSVDGQLGEIPDFSNADLNIGTGFNPDRDAQPLVRIPPQYPQNCISRADPVESVLVEFDVSPEGDVINARVIDSSNSCLNRAALRAVTRWKYRPKIVNEQAEARFSVSTVITFELGDSE